MPKFCENSSAPAVIVICATANMNVNLSYHVLKFVHAKVMANAKVNSLRI